MVIVENVTLEEILITQNKMENTIEEKSRYFEKHIRNKMNCRNYYKMIENRNHITYITKKGEYK